jgi:predicted DNA-binding protein
VATTKKMTTTVYLELEQLERLKVLSAHTKVPMAEYVRQGVDLVMKKYSSELPGQETLPLDLE